jgi:RNA polymerase-interacting CarD/CdnL/TRCF family regulator
MSQKLEFRIGDAVFYPRAGVGRIEGTEDIYLTGRQESCFVIRILETAAVIKVPQTNMARVGVRRLLDGKRVKTLYGVLAAGSKRRTATNWAEHCKGLERIINAGSCLELGAAVRDLMRRKQTRGLSFEESKLLVTASGHLVREIALSEGIPPDKAYERIRHHIGVRV